MNHSKTAVCETKHQSAATMVMNQLYLLKELAESVEQIAYTRLDTILESEHPTEDVLNKNLRRVYPPLFEEYDTIISMITNSLHNTNRVLSRVDI